MHQDDYIKLKDSDTTGQILRILSKNKLEVMLENGFVVKIDVSKVEPGEAPKEEKRAKKKSAITIPPPKVDLHIEHLISNRTGLTNFDIIQIQMNEFEKQLDAAIACGMLEITFVHGIGAGILRQEIRNRLKNNKQIKSFMDAHYDRGATTVKLY